MTTPSDIPTRRVPMQARSRMRVERILDAAAQLFADEGYDAATTEAIAARAETSIGSLYQFFPNKDALWDAIVSRYLARSRELFDRLVIDAKKTASWEELLDGIIDAFFAFDRRDPDIRAIWANWHRASTLLAAGHAANVEFAKRGEIVLARHTRSLSPKKRTLVALVLVETISAMLILAARRDESGADEVVAETKVLLRRYLEPYASAKRPRAR